MTTLLKPALAAGLAIAAIATAPAVQAQVSGPIATVNAPEVVIKSAAFRNAYQQIDATYAAQRTTIQERSQQRQALLTQLDTNGDGRLDEAEQQAAQTAPQRTQIEQLEQEIQQISGEIDLVRVFAVEQILRQYVTALQQVVQSNNIQMVLANDSIVFAQPAANISDKIVADLNTRLPTVQTTPPANYQPARQSVAIFQEVSQLLLAAQAQAQAQRAQPAAPAAQQPTGR
ncbi:MAG: OmpH family outer membrane protein [Pontixanthobacter sp.]